MDHEVVDDRYLALKPHELIGSIRATSEKSVGDGPDEDVIPEGAILEKTAPKFVLAQQPT
jgi:hypothetical protein